MSTASARLSKASALPAELQHGILHDMPVKINPLDVEIQAWHDEFILDVDASWRGHHIGHAWCTIEDSRLQLCDITVDDKAFVPFPFAHSLLLLMGVPSRTVNARGLGIGRRLMERLIVEARTLGIREIWGSVNDGDANASPFLLDWYRRVGFDVVPADGECIKGATWKISMRQAGD